MDRTDDNTIVASDRLWRRIHPSYLKPLEDGSGFGVSSAAFRDKTGELSVHLAALTSDARVLAEYPTFSLGELQAGVPRGLGMLVCRDPLPEDASHTLICPAASKSQAKKLAEACALVVTRPPGA